MRVYASGIVVGILAMEAVAPDQAAAHGQPYSRRFNAAGHYEYLPAQYYRHGDHQDVQPGRYIFDRNSHRTPNYQVVSVPHDSRYQPTPISLPNAPRR